MELRKYKETYSTGDLQATGNTVKVKTYTINIEKAVDKKAYACQKEHIKFELKAGKNFVVELSTGAYEMVKRTIPTLLETAGLDNSYSMVSVQEGKEESV
jgi:predicted secreted protein